MVGPKTAGQLAEAMGTTLEAAGAWLTAGLRNHGVLLRLQDDGRRMYWLPGVGNFSLVDRGPNRPPLIGGPLGPLHRELEIRARPGAHARAAAAASTGRDAGPTYRGSSMSVKDKLVDQARGHCRCGAPIEGAEHQHAPGGVWQYLEPLGPTATQHSTVSS
jgi:hypothetical protein